MAAGQGREAHYAVATGALGRLKGPVGLVEKFVFCARVRRERRDADAHGQRRSALGADGGHALAHALGDLVGARRAAVDQYDRELVAAVAGDEVDAPAAIFEDAGDAAQGVVAGFVAEGVVVSLELVEIDEQQGELAVLAARALNVQRHAFSEELLPALITTIGPHAGVLDRRHIFLPKRRRA